MDKFLLLVRRVFAAHVRCARESRWTGSQVDKLLEILERECFDAQERGDVALGLRLHVLDLWVDEMEREHALGDKAAGQDLGSEMQVSRGDFVRRVGDVVETLRRSPVRSVRARAEESFADPRLPWAVLQQGEEEEAENDEEDGWGGIED